MFTREKSLYLATVVLVSIFSCTLLLRHHHVLTFVANDDHSAALNYLGDVAINCGSTGKSNAFDGREWIGDAGWKSVLMSSLQPKGKTKSSTAVDSSFVVDPVPYKTSRISAMPFHYTLPVTPGQKFIRLHFHRALYHGFENSVDYFTVKAGPFTLLRNFSVSHAAEALGVNFIVKEFCLSVEESAHHLSITFSPSGSSTSSKVVAFVNGIEVISMPAGLYYTKDGESGARNVGLQNRFTFIDNSTALELIERLNIGAGTILSVEDFGLFRRWNGDSRYLMESGAHQVIHPAHRFAYKTSEQVYLAPPKVYQTSWQMEPTARVGGLYTLRWKIPVDVGFGYLVRLHFCDYDPGVTDGGKKELTVLVNDQIAETKIDMIGWRGGTAGIPFYRDYMVMMKGDKEGGKRCLLISLRSANQSVVGLLNGLEIFKLSNPDNSLATPNLVFVTRLVSTSSWKQNIHKLLTLSQCNVIATGITILIVLVNMVAYNLRRSQEADAGKEKCTSPRSIDPSFLCFSLSEIQSATQNFSDAAVIGKGGFGMVYKGFIAGISQLAAIKRLKVHSKQGTREFWTEVETLSKCRHIHLVSLIGYCNESTEMILVYEYMSRGTIADNIYQLARDGKERPLLSWEQRLRICIGAARGLEYLHTGTQCGVIHRDVKDTNILLDENFVAKISDFGLSRLEEFCESRSYISTKVCGTLCYIDPEYQITQKLTRMVDVYGFGVVLLVVLSGRPAVDVRNPEEPRSLLSCFMDCIIERDFVAIVDPNLRGGISPSSLREFVRCVESCLQYQHKKRPTMSEVATCLELALEKQARTILSLPEVIDETSQPYEHGSMEPMQCSKSPSPSPVLGESIACFPMGEHGKAKETREDELSERKPTWGWPWKAVSCRGSRRKKTDVVSSSRSMDEHLHRSGPCFSIQDIRAAANNFSDGFQIIGARGGKAWLGSMEQLERPVIIYQDQFLDFCSLDVQREIAKMSKLRHVNLQSLIGYSLYEPMNQSFIVYEHVGFESLDSHIYCSGTRNTPLSWKCRLSICIGVAEGLAHLQQCTGKETNHDNLRLANILLDENCTPKISHFGLSGFNFMAEYPCRKVKQFIRTNTLPSFKIREDSDSCSFGLLLVEVLLARRISFDELERYLIVLQKSIKSGTFHETIDSALKGEIASTCLAEYLKAIFICTIAIRMPASLTCVATNLKVALELQEKAEAAKQADGIDIAFNIEDIYQDISHLDVFLNSFESKLL